MSIIKCKMCGGNLQIVPGAHTVTCEYCDTLQTLPHLTDERSERLYDRQVKENLRRIAAHGSKVLPCN